MADEGTKPPAPTDRLDVPEATLRMDPSAPPPMPAAQDGAGGGVPGLNAGEEVLGRFFVEQELGGGGEADIFLCRPIEPGKPRVVLKLYRRGVDVDRSVLEKVRGVAHPDVVRVLEVGDLNGRAYEIAEFAEGGSLEGHPFDEPFLTSHVITQAVAALAFCHERGIVHRDLKPSNLFFRDARREDVVLGDFGMSSVVAGLDPRLTNRRGGTWSYAAPESLDGRLAGSTGQTVSPAEDYYALGVTLIALVAGRDPFDGIAYGDVYRAKIQGEVPLPPSVSPRLKLLIAGLLHPHPRRRWGRAQVEEWLRGGSPLVEAPAAPSPGGDEFLYRLRPGVEARSRTELARLLREHPDIAREHIVDGVFDRTLERFDPALGIAVRKIRSTAVSTEAAVAEILFTLDPTLPYQLTPDLLASTPRELAALIDRDKWTWTAGVTHLFDGRLPTWLRVAGYPSLHDEWQNVRGYYRGAEARDAGLEQFLHILDPDLPNPQVSVEPSELHVGEVSEPQFGELMVRNAGRGHLEGTVSLATAHAGLSLSAHELRGRETRLTLFAEPHAFDVGETFRTTIEIRTNGGHVDVPVSIAVAIPQRSLWPRVLPVAAAGGLLGAAFRWFLGSVNGRNPAGWLTEFRYTGQDWEFVFGVITLGAAAVVLRRLLFASEDGIPAPPGAAAGNAETLPQPPPPPLPPDDRWRRRRRRRWGYDDYYYPRRWASGVGTVLVGIVYAVYYLGVRGGLYATVFVDEALRVVARAGPVAAWGAFGALVAGLYAARVHAGELRRMRLRDGITASLVLVGFSIAVSFGASVAGGAARDFWRGPFVPPGELTLLKLVTASGVTGYNDYEGAQTFRPGQVMCLYAEILSSPVGEPVDAQLTFDVPFAAEKTEQKTDPYGPVFHSACWFVPSDTAAGRYDGSLSVHDRLRGRTVSREVAFTVTGAPSAATAGAAPEPTPSARPFLSLSRLSLTHGSSGFRSSATFDPSKHRDKVCGYFELANTQAGGRVDAVVRSTLTGQGPATWTPLVDTLREAGMDETIWGEHCFLVVDQPGVYTLRVRVTDRIGNRTTSREASFIVPAAQAAAPAPTVTAPTAADWVRRARELAQKGDNEGALGAAETAVRLDPSNAEAAHLWNDLRALLRRSPAAAPARPATAREWLDEARRKIAARDFAAALRAVETARRLEPGSADAVALRAEIRNGIADRYSPFVSAPLLIREARLVLDEGNADLAARLAQQALKHEASNVDAIDLLNRARAAGPARETAPAAGQTAAVLVREARRLLEQRDYKGAERLAQAALKRDPSNIDAVAVLNEARAAQRR